MVRKKIIQFIKNHKIITNFIKNNKREIITITAITIIVVFILYAIYFEFAKYPVPRSFTTRPDIEPKDWLTFWGSFLSFIGTISLGTVVYIQNERLNNKNRELEQNKFNQENCSVIEPHNICRISLSNVTEYITVHHMSWALSKNNFDFVSLAQRDNKISNIHEHIINNKDDYICLTIVIYFNNDRRHIAQKFTINYFSFSFIYNELLGKRDINFPSILNSIFREKEEGFIFNGFLTFEEREKIQQNNEEIYFKIDFNLYLDKKLHSDWIFKNDFGLVLNYGITFENALNIKSDFQIQTIINSTGGIDYTDFEKCIYKYLDSTTQISKVRP